jgi:hypothetical protein
MNVALIGHLFKEKILDIILSVVEGDDRIYYDGS